MLDQLGVRSGQRVLEIGSGTGWNAALLAHLVGPSGSVSTVDIQPEVVAQARANLDAAGASGVRVVVGDGADGFPDEAPYDRIILTAAARDLSPAWSRQLAPGGRLVLPLSLRGAQSSVAFERAGDHLTSVSIVDCGFMPLQGTLAGVDPIRPLGRPSLLLNLEDPRPVDAAALLAALGTGGGATMPVAVSRREVRAGLRLWLALHEPDAGDLLSVKDARTMPIPVLVGADSLAVLVTGNGTTGIRGYGPGGDALAARLLGHVRAWVAAGRPGTAGLRIRAYPAGADVPPPVIARPHTTFTATWD
jgi:protein-L-isoaspartate(D-aspartate) O-methyltransferase